MPPIHKGIFRWMFLRSATLEDFADRINHFWTCGLFLVIACIISWKQGIDTPIVCWCPAEFTGSMVNYAQTTCWKSHSILEPHYLALSMDSGDVYFGPQHLPVITSTTFYEKETNKDNFMTTALYQWVPVLLCFQALLFKLPNIIMHVLHGLSGVSFDKLSGLTCGYSNLNMNERELLGRQTGRYVYKWCKLFDNCLPWRLLTALWFFVKLLYCINVIAQIFLIDSFLRPNEPPIDNSTSYSDMMLDNLFENNATVWKDSPAFPRHVLCEFQIRMIRNIQEYRVQCDLPANEFNEQAYMFLWVWLLFAAVVSCLSLITWIAFTLLPLSRKRYIYHKLSLVEEMDVKSVSQIDLDKFADFVGEDGVMTLKLIGANSSDHVVRDVICTMWRMWIDERPALRHAFPGGDVTHVPVTTAVNVDDAAAAVSMQKL